LFYDGGSRLPGTIDLLRTPDDQLSKNEQQKIASNMIRGTLADEFRDLSTGDVQGAAENLAKSHGIYLEYNRAKTGREKDWMYMVRLSVPGGGTFNREQWRIIDDAATRHAAANPFGGPSIRLTTRQNVQYHWVTKAHLIELIQEISRTRFYALNGCGDNTRNVMACPLGRWSDVYDGNAMAHQYGAYFRLPMQPHIQVFAIDPAALEDDAASRGEDHYDYGPKLLNRKFKIAFSQVHRNPHTGAFEQDNCVELRTNDMGIAPIVNQRTGKVDAYQVYIGGGQGEKNGKSTFAALSVPVAIFTEDNLMKGLHDIVKVHEEWGDRKNRHWARLKYVVHAQGLDWYREQLRDKGATFELPDPAFDVGPRQMHHGWMTLPTTGKLAYGAYIECGRLVDTSEGDDPEHKSGNVTGNGRLKSMVRTVMDEFDGVELLITANQDLLFVNIDESAKQDFDGRLRDFGFGARKGKAYSTLRVLSGACVGLPTCRLSYTDSEQFEPELIDQLDAMGYGDMHESIGITGCERQCFRPGTKTLGWVGQGPDMYALKIGASEDGRHQGFWLVDEDKWYLRQVPRNHVADVCAALFDNYRAGAKAGEDMGAFHRRLGMPAIVAYLKGHEKTAALMEKTLPAPYQLDDTAGAPVALAAAGV
jgi:sulfite reductase beta subunit-like hemoprotein